ncbi:hypothetical protein F2Q70_00004040 [Brassica cretica]|uniref:Uncharacterized protein n=1 Tax=Brassica cretica TaxID=69181 RepID=A0A8S9J0F3_BRACR|nr:hypothetical protein F2Q70_00004040 [Brassica cretica]
MEIRRAYRCGKREMAEVMKNRRDRFLCEFGELKGSYQALGNYRECRGTVGGLYLMQDSEYSFVVENARQTWLAGSTSSTGFIPSGWVKSLGSETGFLAVG